MAQIFTTYCKANSTDTNSVAKEQLSLSLMAEGKMIKKEATSAALLF